ncbi:putative nuclease HARBI1 [Rhizophagus clarus]|uniref:Putative nuclease HARBI1 n=1 Tax=Rhizophagus clarus TaxID=94130 RepID=A0A8H3LIV6_9GLOM|nr:putative nuclease HARBI1 [Rhizophagus clarus]
MDLQQQGHHQKNAVLFFILQIIIANKRYQNIQMQRIFDIYYLLTFNNTITNATIPIIISSPPYTRMQRQPRPKTDGFWTDVFPFLSDGNGHNSFQKHFRINFTTFRAIVNRLETHPAFISDSSNATPVWKQIAIVIWRLANGAGIRVLEQTLGVSQGSVGNFTDRFLVALLDLERRRITWPQGSRLVNVIQGFEHGETGRKLPNVIGAMDGSHIPIHAPSKNGARYVNRKNFHSINLLGIVDHQERFTYIHVGEAGSVHDARVFHRSSLYNEVSLHPEQWVPGGTYIIADAAYPLRTYLIKAFPDYYMLNHREKHFNKVLSSMRMVVERAFGHLKERWRILLKELYCTDIERINKIIFACCILHNFCIDMNDLLSLEDDINREIEEIEEDIDIYSEFEAENDGREETAGTQKREYLADLLMQ